MCIEGVIFYVLAPDDRNWMISIPKGFSWGVIKLNIICFILALSTCFLVCTEHIGRRLRNRERLY